MIERPKSRRQRTCSPECSSAWAKARFRLDPEAHLRQRRTQARSILRHPEKHPETRVAWAMRMLSGDPPPPNRRFTQGGSEASRVEAEVLARRDENP